MVVVVVVVVVSLRQSIGASVMGLIFIYLLFNKIGFIV